jgi:hypothetical protein
MSTAADCLPTVIATRAPWHRRVWHALHEGLQAGRRRLRRDRARIACAEALRHQPTHALRDIGVADCVRDAPARPGAGWEYGRWQ